MKIVEHYVSRNFNVGDRVKSYFKKEWFAGEVVDKYKKDFSEAPYILVKTDKRIDDEQDSFLEGFGLEGKVDNLRTIFEDEPDFGDEMYDKTYLRDMTEEEKYEDENLPF
ncbi:hypothetical protein HOD29_06070 [archaeon]|jgi:hypothetical protein|nr:hypothetical protein [archaeon]